MPRDHETRAGAFSGLLAGVLVIALTVMAFSAIDTRTAQTQIAEINVSLPDIPSHATRPHA